MAGATKASWEELRREVVERTDIEWAYRELGVELTGRPNSSGWASIAGDASARVNVGSGPARGRFRDFGGEGFRGSLFDYAVHVGKFANYKDAIRYYADAAAVEIPARLTIRRAVDKFEWQEWTDSLVELFCRKKPPITLAAVRAAGGRLAMYPIKVRANSLIMFPVCGPHLADGDAVAWTGLSRGKSHVEIYSGPTKLPRQSKTLTIKDDGAAMVWVGVAGVDALAEAEIVWKVEGITDMLALLSEVLKLPEAERRRYAVVTNADGCNGTPSEFHAASVSEKAVYVVHDADRPGQGMHGEGELSNGRPRPLEGAKKWCVALAATAREVRNVQLPFEVAEHHGKDLRDFFLAGGTFARLLELAAEAPIVAPPAADNFAQSQAVSDIESRYRQICDDVGIEVIGEWGNGNVELYSRYHGKTQRIDRFSKIKFEDLKAFCGPPGEMHIANTAMDVPGMHRLSTVRSAVLFLSGYNEMTEDCFTGYGCYRSKDASGRQTDGIVIVNSDEVAVYSEGAFRVLREPKHGGLYFHLSKTPGWCDFELLSEMVAEAADADWRADALMMAEREFARWNWQHSSSAQLLAGLATATFIQGLWRWRPQVAITGRSNAGKSYLFETIEHIFSGLAVNLSSDSTPKGILQEIGRLNKILIIDEWDKTPYRDQVLSMLRNAGRGKTSRATGRPSQQSQKTGLKIIGWIAGITSNATEEADWNRFVTLELLPARAGEAGKLTISPESEMRTLGHRLLAVAVTCGLEAVALAERLKGVQFPNVNARMVESYAVPAAMLCCGIGGDSEDCAKGLMEAFLSDCAEQSPETRSDEQQLFDAILGTTIDAGRRLGRRSVESLVEMVLGRKPSLNVSSDDLLDATPYLRHVGLAVDLDERALIIHPPSVDSGHLLRGTRFEGASLTQLLRRITGGHSVQSKRLGGGNKRVFVVPLSTIGVDVADNKDDF